MKIMIFGDTASGKSTFSEKLSRVLDIPVIHLDIIMDDIGRNNDTEIRDYIFKEAEDLLRVFDLEFRQEQ